MPASHHPHKRVSTFRLFRQGRDGDVSFPRGASLDRGSMTMEIESIETAKLNGVDPYAYLTDVITRIVAGHPQSQLDDLLPWVYAPAPLKAVT